MADIFQQELDSTEEHETNNENTPASEITNSKCDESENSKIKENGDIGDEFDADLENFLNLESQSLPRLEELASSDYIHNRQLAAKRILDSLQRAGSNQEEYQSIISVMCKLSEDEESMVRSELIQHIPSIALYCQNHSGLKLVISQQLVPYTVKLLNDSHLSVRKLAQTALLVLLENNLIGQLQLSEWICPLVAQLATCASNLDEQRIEDVTVMSMMIPLVEHNLTLKFFLEPYISLCSDRALGIRTVCAMRFGTLCKIAGTETTETILLPTFLELCEDLSWGVRKACANVFVDVTNVVSLNTRKEILSKALLNLLEDTSNHVRLAAYQSLGGFICSFADPSKTGFVCENGKVRILPLKKNADKKLSHDLNNAGDIELDVNEVDCNEVAHEQCVTTDVSSHSFKFSKQKKKTKENAEDIYHVLAVNHHNKFNNFQFWRAPLPEIDLDVEELTEVQTETQVNQVASACKSQQLYLDLRVLSSENVSSSNNNGKDSSRRTDCGALRPKASTRDYAHPLRQSLEDDTDVSNSSFRESILIFESDTESENKYSNENHLPTYKNLDLENASPYEMSQIQDIVPFEILRKYVEVLLTKSTVDNDELNAACAFSFPAVTFTLGRKYWPCLREIFEKVTSNVQSFSEWRNRCAIASSLPQLASLLGEDIVLEDLLPKFLEFLSDVDEVRQSVVKQIPDFLQHVPPDEMYGFFMRIKDFLEEADSMKWRFRCSVAEQLSATLKLCDSEDIEPYFVPVAMLLLEDKVFAVRHAAAEFMANIIKHVCDDSKLELLSRLNSQYRQADKWNKRQIYVLICEQLVMRKSLPVDTFVEEVVPKLFALAWDIVPNVRLAVSRCIALTLLPQDYLPSIQKRNYDLLLQVMFSLQSDIDQDVRHFGLLSARAFSVLPEKKLSPV